MKQTKPSWAGGSGKALPKGSLSLAAATVKELGTSKQRQTYRKAVRGQSLMDFCFFSFVCGLAYTDALCVMTSCACACALSCVLCFLFAEGDMRTVKDLSRIMSIDGADEVRAHLIMLHDICLRALLLKRVDDAYSPTDLSMGASRPR